LSGGFLDETNLWNYGAAKRWRKGDTKTLGGVVKPFRSLSFVKEAADHGAGLTRFLGQTFQGLNFHYNQSDSFKPADTVYNVFLDELPNPTSKAKEYGFSLNMFDNRLAMRVTHHQTEQIHTRATTSVLATRAHGMDSQPGGQNLT